MPSCGSVSGVHSTGTIMLEREERREGREEKREEGCEMIKSRRVLIS